ncbi:MAG: membrane protein insertase YidC [Parasphingorhabdus sp.]|nr:membrane protein insertase YidC [Parasphingorhabdus sp.]
MEDKRNLLLAVLLTGLILFGWPLVMDTFFPGMANKNDSIEAANNPATDQRSGKPDATATAGAGSGAPVVAGGSKIIALNTALSANPRVAVATPRLNGSINLVGAKFDDLTLVDYRVELAKKSPPVRLFAPSNTEKAYFSRFGWSAADIKVPDDQSVWNVVEGNSLTPKTPVTLRWANDSGQIFQLRFAIDDNYLITAQQSVTNNGAAPVAVTPYSLISRVHHDGIVPQAEQDSWTIHIGPMGVFDGTADYDWDYDDIRAKGDVGVPMANPSWIGFTDKYWLAAIIPDAKAKADAKFRSGAGDIYQTQLSAQKAISVAPGATTTASGRLFAGAKETSLLDRYEDQYNITLLDRAIDWGWFYWFEKPIFYTLHWLFKYIGNFGVAIICLTFIVRGLMFPIAQKQFASMAQMRAVQPKMKKIQDRWKDDKQRQQQEIMKLYKDEKVNPLAGCAPILLQIPVFFALYKVLMLSIEMRHQPFALWIKDLSAPDPLTPVNLFGLIPFDPPTFLAIGVLPILMGITMYFQFKLNPAPMDPVQKQIFSLMPWFMIFVMAPFAAGLQLYWTVSNLLTIAQQKLLYSRHPELKEPLLKVSNAKE